MNKTIVLFTFLFLSCLGSFTLGQKINITLPTEGNQPYYFILNQGLKQDTIQKGTLNFAGNVTINIPVKYKNYKGIALLGVADKQPLFLVVNNENFEIENTGQSFRFNNSKENDYLYKVFQGDNSLAPVPELYAWHFLEMMEYVRRQNMALSQGTDFIGKTQLRQYATDKLNMEYLYTSNLWYFVIDNLMKLENDQIMIGDDMVKILKRIKSQEVFESLADNLVTITEQYGFEDAFDIIISYIQESGRIPVPQGKMFDAFTKAKFRKGMVAPKLSGYKKQMDIPVIDKTLIIFYDPECHNCEIQLEELIKNYSTLIQKGIQIISVSSASEKKDNEKDIKRFPWANKLCDFKGFAGSNFTDFGVISTPTIFLLDKDNKLIGRYALISQMNLN